MALPSSLAATSSDAGAIAPAHRGKSNSHVSYYDDYGEFPLWNHSSFVGLRNHIPTNEEFHFGTANSFARDFREQLIRLLWRGLMIKTAPPEFIAFCPTERVFFLA